MSRRRRWLHHGIVLSRRSEHGRRKLQPIRNYSRIRILGIRRLLSIHPAATKFDLQLLCQVIGPELFEETPRTEAKSRACISNTE
jgi:hypothetical protein